MNYDEKYKKILGKVLWVGALLALVAAWMASSSELGLVLGRDEIHWYLDALALGVLALGCKMNCDKDCVRCDSRDRGVTMESRM